GPIFPSGTISWKALITLALAKFAMWFTAYILFGSLTFGG
ncbi:inner-membrane translocator, partial [Listeria innocua FSL S4-378]